GRSCPRTTTRTTFCPATSCELERKAGRGPQDTRYQGAPADIESPPRLIEIKAVGKESCRGEFLWLDAAGGRRTRSARTGRIQLSHRGWNANHPAHER